MSRYVGDAGYSKRKTYLLCDDVFPGWDNREQNGVFIGSKPERGVTPYERAPQSTASDFLYYLRSAL